MDENQIILIDKPANISSFGVVAKVRSHLKSIFGHKVKVGHTGTLDPFATGLLIILTGKNTKKSSEFLKLDKVYEATLKLGYTSSTGDPEGKIEEYLKVGSEESVGGYDRDRRSAPPVTTGRRDSVPEEPSLDNLEGKVEDYSRQIQYCSVEDPLATTGANGTTEPRNDGREGARPKQNDIELAINSFIGTIKQTPPRFSAIKVNGQRAYKLARKGQDFEIPSRKVKIYSIEILSYHYPELKIKVHCSSGTYIRTLAEDIGQRLGTGAYLTALRRTRIGDFSIENAKPLEDFIEKRATINLC